MSPCLGVIFFPSGDTAWLTWNLSPSFDLNVSFMVPISPSISPQELESAEGLSLPQTNWDLPG